jgi:hypothetical protein
VPAVVFDLVARTTRWNRGFDDAHRKATGFQKTMGRVGTAITGALAGGAVIGAVKSFTDAFEDSRRVAAQTDAVIRSTGGAAGLSAKGFADLAAQISKTAAVDDDLVQAGANVLATFTNIKAGGPDKIFERAEMAAVDMAAALNQGQVTAEGLQSANIQLGKALNDPIKGVTALQRVGVSFTAQQKKQIEAMVAAGNVAGAQKLILGELSKEFGGSAEAAATSGKRLSVAWGNAQETLGGLLLPAIERGQELLVGFIGVVDRNRTAFAVLGGAVAAVTGFVLAMSAATKVTMAVQAAAKGATVAWTAAQWLLNAALAANPIGLVVAAVALLVAGIVLAYKRSETFRTVVGKAWDAVKDKVATVVSFIITILRGWLNFQFAVVQGILHVMGKLPGPMGAPFRKAEEAVKQAKETVNTQLDKIQARVDKLRGKDIPISASLKLNFSPTFTQKDWVNVRLLAGRMAQGGPVLGPGPRGRDSELRWLAPGEHVWTDREVLAAGGHRAMERWRRAVLTGRIPELARGGPVERIDAQTRNVNKVQAWGTARRMDAGLTKLLGMAPTSIPHTAGSWKIAVDYLRRLGMAFDVISTFRPGARTHATGAVSYHALNRAVDIHASNMLAIFEALARTNPTELIYSGASRYKSRRGWRPIGALDPITLADHWSHVHAAYDQGGWLLPGTTVAHNTTGRPERVLPPGQPTGDIHVHLDLRGATFTGPPQDFVAAVLPQIRQGLRDMQRRAGVPVKEQLR